MTGNRENPSHRPPYSNRGVYPSIAEGPPGPAFDAYLATVHAHPSLVIDVLEDALESAGKPCQRLDGPPVRFYSSNALLVDESGHRRLSVRSGGSNKHPFVEAKGDCSGVVADALRSARFSHLPKRIDSAIDISAPGLFLALVQRADEIANRHGLSKRNAGADHDDTSAGSTRYYGSRQSQCFGRIYEKGYEIAERTGLPVADMSERLRNLVRIEVEFKPQKRPARVAACSFSPSDVWGTSQWSYEFAREALSIDAERVNVNHRRESNHDRALRFMAQQYRAHLQTLLDAHQGDRAAAFQQLLELAELDQLQPV